MKERFIENVLKGFYTDHNQGEQLLLLDLDEVILEALAELANDEDEELKDEIC